MINKTSQAQKDNTISPHLYVESKNVRLIEADWEVGEMERYWSKGIKFQLQILET
jgi:hypothetical protein